MKAGGTFIGESKAAPQRRWAVAFLCVALAYLLVFLASREATLVGHVQAVLRNVLSLAIAAAAARAVIVRSILPLTGRAFWFAHGALCVAFSIGWFWLLTLAAAMLDAGSATRFTVAPYLIGAGMVWQLLQGLHAYAAIAALTTLEQRPSGGAVIAIDKAGLEETGRFLLREGEDLTTIAAIDIVSITGADDYAEVVTTRGAHLVATTLAEFETLLGNRRFVRVHRSAIANLDHLGRAEPVGGGRMILRMTRGPDLPVSRNGARLLREGAL